MSTEANQISLPSIAVIGGTGQLGAGLARQWALRGYRVTLGSRSADKAQSAAAELSAGFEPGRITGAGNAQAAKASDIVVLAVPWASHDTTLQEIAQVLGGKILIDAVVPLVPPKVATVQLPTSGSAALAAARIVGDTARVVSAFHNVGAAKLRDGVVPDCDVLVFGDDRAARDEVIGLVHALGMRGVDGGPLANSTAAEALTSVLIGINRRYKVEGAGIRITGLTPTVEG
jgi:NADPH-dependent F420 reductase